MANRLTHELRELKDAEPGTRFQAGCARTRVDNRIARLFLVVLGLSVMITASVTFWVPGPNFVLVLAGLALAGGQSETIARSMDRLEVRGRRFNDEVWAPHPHQGRVKLLGAIGFLVALVLVAWLAHQQGWLPSGLPSLR